MEIGALHLALGPLLSCCYSAIKNINELHHGYKFAPITLASIATACGVTRVALGQVQSLHDARSDAERSLPPDFYEQLDVVRMGCSMTLSQLEGYVKNLLNVNADEMFLVAQNASRLERIKALYNESDMKELLGQLRDHSSLLQVLINVMQRYVLLNM